MSRSLGVLCYDVPVNQKSVYNKLRRAIKGYALPMTWSVYLIQWGMKNEIEEVLQEIIQKKRIRYRILKFDDSDQQALEEACQDALRQLISQTKETLHKRLKKADEKFLEEQRDTGEWEKESLWAVKQAQKALKEANHLAFLFDMSDIMEFAFEALNEELEAKRQMVAAKFREQNEVKVSL